MASVNCLATEQRCTIAAGIPTEGQVAERRSTDQAAMNEHRIQVNEALDCRCGQSSAKRIQLESFVN